MSDWSIGHKAYPSLFANRIQVELNINSKLQMNFLQKWFSDIFATLYFGQVFIVKITLIIIHHLTANPNLWLSQAAVLGDLHIAASSSDLLCADSDTMAAPNSVIVWLYFCTVGRNGDMLSIFFYLHWLLLVLVQWTHSWTWSAQQKNGGLNIYISMATGQLNPLWKIMWSDQELQKSHWGNLMVGSILSFKKF